MTRSVARADVAELNVALESAVVEDDDHHLVIVSTNKVISSTQFKQMFYSRGDDFFQIANCYACPDSASSIHSSVWGIMCHDFTDKIKLTAKSHLDNDQSFIGYASSDSPFHHAEKGHIENNTEINVLAVFTDWDPHGEGTGPHDMHLIIKKDDNIKFRKLRVKLGNHDIEFDQASAQDNGGPDVDYLWYIWEIPGISEGSLWKSHHNYEIFITSSKVCNFNKLGGRDNDPPGVAWAYSYVHDQSRNFYAQHEVMGYLEQDTCVKRDYWSVCSRMNIEDQLYGLAFASETDKDLCMEVTCARRWSEVEDALVESCLAGGQTSWDGIGKGTSSFDASHVDLYINVRITNAHPEVLDTILRVRFTIKFDEHNPSELNSWNTRASNAGSGVIQSGVVGDAPEGGEGEEAGGSKVLDQDEIHHKITNLGLKKFNFTETLENEINNIIGYKYYSAQEISFGNLSEDILKKINDKISDTSKLDPSEKLLLIFSTDNTFSLYEVKDPIANTTWVASSNNIDTIIGQIPSGSFSKNQNLNEIMKNLNGNIEVWGLYNWKDVEN